MTFANSSTEYLYRGKITVTFHGALTDFFKTNAELFVTHFELQEKTSLKHVVEALGVPHPEIGKIIVNQNEVNLSYHHICGDHVHVYPFRIE